MAEMQSYRTNDRVTLKYIDTGAGDSGEEKKPLLILIHGFTGSSAVWARNIPALSSHYRVIAPDLRGHGESDKPKYGYHVSRLAMDLRGLLAHVLDSSDIGKNGSKLLMGSVMLRAIGGSLGAAVLWSYAELFTTIRFTHVLFVDQSPLQDLDPITAWDTRFSNLSMNNPTALANLRSTLATTQQVAYLGTIHSCLGYLSHPLPTDTITPEQKATDAAFFLKEAEKGDPQWFGKLMADHTALDWRDSIRANFGPESGSKTKVFVVASQRSGCFAAEGPLSIVGLVNGDVEEVEKRAKGVAVDWGGHWCYWEDPEKFNELCLDFLKE